MEGADDPLSYGGSSKQLFPSQANKPIVENLFHFILFLIFLCFSFLMAHSRPLFLYFRLFNTVDSNRCSICNLPMTGFELETFGVGSNCSAN